MDLAATEPLSVTGVVIWLRMRHIRHIAAARQSRSMDEVYE